MYITNLKIRTFRAIENLELTLNKGLNVLIGENNAGKTSVIDLLRLVLDKGNYPNNIYWKESDFRVSGSDNYEPIEFDIIFNVDDKQELFWFNSLHVVDFDDDENQSDHLEIHGRISLVNSKGNKKFKREFWAGKDEQNKISWEIWNALNYIYLSPLRDFLVL